ncbi:hypothetical protein [Actinoallomurus acaciae]|uniref:Uncharacterized protein n=1 Tax=Actinoallomurus acaciae TaxID=502577 RepID=A0ABV5Y9N2_9ACTN
MPTRSAGEPGHDAAGRSARASLSALESLAKTLAANRRGDRVETSLRLAAGLLPVPDSRALLDLATDLDTAPWSAATSWRAVAEEVPGAAVVAYHDRDGKRHAVTLVRTAAGLHMFDPSAGGTYLVTRVPADLRPLDDRMPPLREARVVTFTPDGTTLEAPEPASADRPPRMRVEDVLDRTHLVRRENSPLAILLPGAPMEGSAERFAARMAGLADMVPEGGVAVFGTVRGGRVMAGDEEVTVEAMAAAIARSAPEAIPYLLIDGGAAVAEPLSRSLDRPVLATPHTVVHGVGHVTSRRSSGAASDTPPPEDWFRVFYPGVVEGEPIVGGLFSAFRAEGGAPEPAATPVEPDPVIRSIGVPRAGLPQLAELMRRIRQELDTAGVRYSENELALLPHRFLANYPYLGMNDPTGDSGLQVPVGDGELLVGLDATDPYVPRDPAGSAPSSSDQASVEGTSRGVGTINSVFATGAHVQVQAGQTSATRGALSFTFGIGATPGVLNLVRVGLSLSGTANQSNRSNTHVSDAEGGHVEDNRSEMRLVAYTARWSFKVRREPDLTWAATPAHRLDASAGERLLLWIPDHYLGTADPRQVTAVGEEVRRDRLPSFFYASGMTGLPRLFDEIVAALAEGRLTLPLGSAIRQELLQKLWNLNMHLDAAVNTGGGYWFTLHDNGRPVAMVRVRSRRRDGAPRVGATSDKAHVENVRTAIDGSRGSHTLTNTGNATVPSLEFDLAPVPGAAGQLAISTYALSYTSSNVDGISAGRVGLNVLVPRNTSYTNGYHMSFSHRATVTVRGDDETRVPRTTREVESETLVRIPEAAAYEHGLSVDRTALKEPPEHGGEREYEAGAVRGTADPAGDPPPKPVPQYVADGKGIGMGLVMVDDGTVEQIRAKLMPELRAQGFLPAQEDDPFAGYTWSGHGNTIDSLIDNAENFDKMVSSRGLDSHYDQIHQNGMTFTLRRRRGRAGVDWDIDAAKVTIRARRNDAGPPRFIRSTDEFHTVNLAMGFDSAGLFVSHTRKVAWGLKLKGLFNQLRTAVMGVEWQRIRGAADSLNLLNNRPELLEYPGTVDEFELTSDYEITVEYQHSGHQGRFLRGRRDPAPLEVPAQTARAYLPPLGTEEGPVSAGPTPREVLEQGVVYFLDTTGVDEAVTALGRMTDPAGTASSERDTFTGTIEMRAHLKEILRGEYTTDRPFEPGVLRDTFGAVDIRGTLGPTRFTGATTDKFVLGLIKLWLSESQLADTRAGGLNWDQLDVAAGGNVGDVYLNAEADANRHWQRNRSSTNGRTGGKELLQLNFNRVYAFETTVDFTVASRREKLTKLWSSSIVNETEEVKGRTLVFLLPEPEALLQYAEGRLEISDRRLRDAMLRWHTGRLPMSGDLVARILVRWRTKDPGRPQDVWFRGELARLLTRVHATGAAPVLTEQARQDFNREFGWELRAPDDPYLRPRTPADVVAYAEGRGRLTDERLAEALDRWRDGRSWLSGDVVARTLIRWRDEVPDLGPGAPTDRDALVLQLAGLHTAGGTPISSAEVRDRFNAVFGRRLANPRRPYHLMEMPEYLTREDPGGRFLGHSGVYELKYSDGRTTFQIVREVVDRVAPGLLAADAGIWDGRGRRIGRMQGGVDALQSILAEGRDQAMWEDVLSQEGFSLYLVNPIGWMLADVVEINLTDLLTSAPEVYDRRWNTGIEVYSHGYIGTSTARSRDGSQAWVFPKLNDGNAHVGGPVDIRMSEGHHRGTTRAESAVSEQTVYDWADHYAVRFSHELRVRVRRLKMPGRALNNLLTSRFDQWTRHSAEAEATASGTLNLEVPHALAEAGLIRGPEPARDLVPLPKLPGNAYVTGVVLDGLLPVSRTMLGSMFGPAWYEKALGARANDPKTRSSLSLPVLLSRSHLTNHIRAATGGDRYKLADELFIPGNSTERAALWLQGDLFDAQVIGRMTDGGTGTGRYIKHQSGTSVNNASDHVRATAEYAVNGTDAVHSPSASHATTLPQRPDENWGTGNAGSRVTSVGQNSSGTENYRREQHAKEIGPTLLIRMRGRFRLEGQKVHRHLMRRDHDEGGPVRSAPVTGDVYVEMFEAQYRQLLADQAKGRREAEAGLRERVDRRAWAGLATAPTFDVHTLLGTAARHRHPASRAHLAVVTEIRERIGAGRPLVLTVGPDATVRHYRRMLRWAVATMLTDLREARVLEPGLATPASLGLYRDRLSRDDDDLTGDLRRPVEDEITAIVNEVNRVHGMRWDNEDGGPAELPPEAAMFALDPVRLARDVAYELGAPVRLDVTRPDGTVRSHWADESGGIHTFDPLSRPPAAVPITDLGEDPDGGADGAERALDAVIERASAAEPAMGEREVRHERRPEDAARSPVASTGTVLTPPGILSRAVRYFADGVLADAVGELTGGAGAFTGTAGPHERLPEILNGTYTADAPTGPLRITGSLGPSVFVHAAAYDGGSEQTQRDFDRVYTYRTTVKLTVKNRAPGTARSVEREVGERPMTYVLPEPEALRQYAEGVLPVPGTHLADALERWRRGHRRGEAALRLSGNVVAGILVRWATENTGPADAHRAGFAESLRELHEKLPVLDATLRRRLEEVLPPGRATGSPAGATPDRHTLVGPNVSWQTSSLSSYDARGNLIPEEDRRCVSVAVVEPPSGANDRDGGQGPHRRR